MRRIIGIASAILFVTLLVAWWSNSRGPKPIALTPTLTRQVEYCLTCHSDLKEISPSHPVKTFGCVICHGGERLALNADLAHSSMRGGKNPSDLSVVEKSCGGSNCHSGSEADQRNHIQRVMTSIQSTYAGAIANIRYSFGAQSDLKARLGIVAVTDKNNVSLQAFDPSTETNSMIRKFGANCLTCHIDATPRTGEIFDRFTGCAACHTPLTPTPLPTLGEGQGVRAQIHKLTTAIPYTQCDTCHNRGNYDLRTMTFVERAGQSTDRLHNYYQPIAQFTRCEYTLDCVDCHTRTEAMGDANIYSSKKDIQYIQCKTCHGTPAELPQIKTLTDQNDIAFRLAQLNPVVDLKLGDTMLVTDKDEALWNTRVLPDGTYQLIGKATDQTFTFKPVMGSHCTQNGQDQSSAYCHECHSVQR